MWMIDMSTFWVVLFVVLLVAELVSAGALISIWFCVGALAAFAAAAANASVTVQVVVFLVISIALLVLTKPFVKKVLKQKNEPTNLDRIMGTEAIVTEDINNLQQTGAVKLEGKVWSARSADETLIPAGTVVRIVRIEGVKVFVRRG